MIAPSCEDSAVRGDSAARENGLGGPAKDVRVSRRVLRHEGMTARTTEGVADSGRSAAGPLKTRRASCAVMRGMAGDGGDDLDREVGGGRDKASDGDSGAGGTRT